MKKKHTPYQPTAIAPLALLLTAVTRVSTRRNAVYHRGRARGYAASGRPTLA